MRGAKCLITREQINLVVRSECINRYPDIKRILEKHQSTKGIYKKDIVGESNETINIIENAFQVIVEEAVQEWYESGYKGRKKTKCQLCNHPKIEDNFEIKNKSNNTTMIIGSSCIGKFSIERTTKNVKQLINANKKVERLTKINEQYPGIAERLRDMQRFYKELPTILPIELDQSFITCMKQLQEFYDGYIELKIPDKRLLELEGYIENYNHIKQKVEEFIKAIENETLCIDRTLKRWLSAGNRKKLKLEIMNQGGIISRDTIPWIHQREFVLRFKEKVEGIFKRNKFNLIEIDEEIINLAYQHPRGTIKFQVTIKKFMEHFGTKLLDGFLEDEANNIMEIVEITNNNINRGKLEDLINYTILIKSGYFINEYESSEKYIKLEKHAKYDINISTPQFLKIVKPLLFIEEKEAAKELIQYCNRLRHWKSKDTYSL